MTPRRLAVLGFVLASAIAPAPRADAGDQPEEPPVPVVLQASDEEVKKVHEALAKAKAEKSLVLQAEAVGEMATLRHDSFVEPIRAAFESDDAKVQAAAIRAAATHELRDLEKDVRKLLRPKKAKKGDAKRLTGIVLTASIDYLARLGIAGEEEIVFEDHLKYIFEDEKRLRQTWADDMLRASLHYLGKMKYRKAVPFLIELVPRPEPKDVNSASNPPATYWEARVKLWQVSESWVRWTLKETTGQEFRSYREWESWVRENKKDFK